MVWTADIISPRRQQYVGHRPDWPSSAKAPYTRQHYCAPGPVRPVPDKYAFQATDRRTNKRTERHRHRVMSALDKLQTKIMFIRLFVCLFTYTVFVARNWRLLGHVSHVDDLQRIFIWLWLTRDIICTSFRSYFSIIRLYLQRYQLTLTTSLQQQWAKHIKSPLFCVHCVILCIFSLCVQYVLFIVTCHMPRCGRWQVRLYSR